MLDAFRSNYERNARPRGLEVESASIHFGLSMYLERARAAATARRRPRLGRQSQRFGLSRKRLLFGSHGPTEPRHRVGKAATVARLHSRYPPCGQLAMHYVLPAPATRSTPTSRSRPRVQPTTYLRGRSRATASHAQSPLIGTAQMRSPRGTVCRPVYRTTPALNRCDRLSRSLRNTRQSLSRIDALALTSIAASSPD